MMRGDQTTRKCPKDSGVTVISALKDTIQQSKIKGWGKTLALHMQSSRINNDSNNSNYFLLLLLLLLCIFFIAIAICWNSSNFSKFLDLWHLKKKMPTGHCLGFLSCCFDKILWQKGERVYFSSEFWVTVLHSRIVQASGGWSNDLVTASQSSNGCLCCQCLFLLLCGLRSII